MEQIKTTAPPVYVIWAEGWTGGPLSGQNGYLAENGARLFFTGKEAAELKIRDLRNGCLNKHPAAGYHCINFNSSSLPDQDLTVEAIRAYDLQPDFDPEDYVATGQAYCQRHLKMKFFAEMECHLLAVSMGWVCSLDYPLLVGLKPVKS